MKNFYMAALKGAKSAAQVMRILRAASRARALSDYDYFAVTEKAA